MSTFFLRDRSVDYADSAILWTSTFKTTSTHIQMHNYLLKSICKSNTNIKQQGNNSNI